jgi:hypothetical protein
MPMWLGFLVALLLGSAVARADEGGTSHFVPGSMASFLDGAPVEPTVVVRLNEIYLRGKFTQERLPVAGLGPLNVHAESLGTALALAWAPDWKPAEKLTYAASVVVPHVWVRVRGDLTAGAATVRQEDQASGLGDMVILPLMLGYEASPDLHFDARLAVYAPTGDYEVGRLANEGKNFWTLDPIFGMQYLGKQNGFEATAFAGITLNTENPDTDYRSGAAFHLDGTLAQHFPLAGGLAGAGLEGFWYRQVQGDSGDGAFLGDFKGRTVGLGPVVSFAAKVGGKDLLIEFKWLNELETKRRPEGNLFWLKVALRF